MIKFRSTLVEGIKSVLLDLFGIGARAHALEMLNAAGLFGGLNQKYVTAATTLTTDDNLCTVVSNGSGALIHVLPAPAQGLAYFFMNIANQNITVNGAAADKIIAKNTLVSDGVVYSTANEKIGAYFGFVAVDTDGAGTYKWLHVPLSSHTATISA